MKPDRQPRLFDSFAPVPPPTRAASGASEVSRVCPYCMRRHSRPSPAIYCSLACSKRAQRQNQHATGKLQRSQARAARERQRIALESERWRAGATGRKTLEQLVAEVFGVREIPAMRDTSE